MSDAEKNDGGLTRREFAKTVVAGVAAAAAAHSLNAFEVHAASALENDRSSRRADFGHRP